MKNPTKYRGKLVFRLAQDRSFPIEIRQQGHDKFSVSYGAEYHENLTYAEAAKKFGESVFHCLACDGLLDNN